MEYPFFNDELQARFTQRLQALGLAWHTEPDKLFGTLVHTADPLPEVVEAELEALYDDLFDEQARLAEQREGWVNKRLAGVQATLPDGRECTIALSPDLANRLMTQFNTQEIAELVSAVATSLQQDYNGPLCQHPLGKTAS